MDEGEPESSFSRIFIADDSIKTDENVLEAVKRLNLEVEQCELDACLQRCCAVSSSDADNSDVCDTVFLVGQFDGALFNKLRTASVPLIGLPALLHYARLDGTTCRLPLLSHALYCTAMKGVVLCFTGFRSRHRLKRWVDLAHYMGGSVRRDVSSSVTHVIASCSSGEKYRYAVTFQLPTIQSAWIDDSWEKRDQPDFSATSKESMEPFKLRPFCGARVRFVGFSVDESEHMREVLVSNGGCMVAEPEAASSSSLSPSDKSQTNSASDRAAVDCTDCSEDARFEPPTHVVVDDNSVLEAPADIGRAHLVRAEWFWASIQMDGAADESLYPFKSRQCRDASPGDLLAPATSLTPKSRSLRKRKRLRATVQQLAMSPGSITSPPAANTRYMTGKRRSSINDVNLLSTSGSFLDATFGGETTDDSTLAAKRRSQPSAFNPRLSSLFENPNSSLSSQSNVHTPLPVSTSPDVCSPVVSAGTGGRSAVASPAATTDFSSMTPRQQVFNELLQTETNYVTVLRTIVTLFKEPLEVVDQMGGPLLEPQDIKTIFGNIPPILEVHTQMLRDFERMAGRWKDDLSIGQVIMQHSDKLMQAYPSFINYFERSKDTLIRLDGSRPRFHAFLKINQSKPECGRQTLQELLIRPVQRLPSIILLLNDLLKHTSKSLSDHQALNAAVARIKEVMTHINEDKRRTEAQMALFNIFNDIENCPPHLVSSHRSYVTRCDVVEIKGDCLSGRGDHLSLFVFSDILEVCKKRARYNSLRSPSTVSLATATRASKPHKHIVLIPLAHIKRVVDVRETDECHNVFTLICRSNQELKERHYTFTITSDDTVKDQFLRVLCRQMAHVTCRADAENFLTQLDPQFLEIDSSDVSLNSTLSRVSRFASKTSRKVGRAFSFKQTPNKLRRAVSTVISPFQGSSSNVNSCSTPAAGDTANSCTPLATAASSLNLMETDSGTPLAPPGKLNGCSTLPHPRPGTPRTSKKFKSCSLGFSTSRLQ